MTLVHAFGRNSWLLRLLQVQLRCVVHLSSLALERPVALAASDGRYFVISRFCFRLLFLSCTCDRFFLLHLLRLVVQGWRPILDRLRPQFVALHSLDFGEAIL